MGTERLLIIVEDGGSARRVKRDIDALGPAGDAASKRVEAGNKRIETSAKAAVPQVDYLKKTISALAVVMGARKIMEYADTYINLQNRLRLVTSSQGELNTVMQKLQEVSERTRASMFGTTNMYARLAVALKTMGVSAQDTMQVTETLNEAIALSGATAQEALGGMIQLAQGLASGVLRGDELRSVLEQLPAVADIIAERLGVTRGRLRELGEQGAITSKMVYEALKNAGTQVHERFLRTASTIGQAFTVMGNSIMVALGRFGEMSGVTKALTDAIKFLAHHLGILTTALIILGSSALPLVIKAIKELTVAMMKNPFLALATAIAVAIGVTQEFMTEFRRLGGTMEDVTLIFEKPIMAAATFAGSMSGLFHGALDATIKAFKGLPGAIGDLFIRAMNAVVSAVEWAINRLVSGINTAIDATNKGRKYLAPLAGPAGILANKVVGDFAQIPLVSLGQFANPLKGAAGQLGKDVGTAFWEGFDAYLLGMQSKVQNFFDRVRKERNRSIREQSERDTAMPGGDAAPSPLLGVRALEELRRELELERELVGLVGFERQVREDLGRIKIDMLRQHIDLQSKEAKGALEIAEAQVRELDALRAKYTLAKSAANRSDELAAERSLIGLWGVELRVRREMSQLEEELRRKRTIASDAEIARALTEQENSIREIEYLREKNALGARLLSVDKERVLFAQFMNSLLQEETITLEQYNRGMREAEQGTNTFSGAVEGFTAPFKELDTSVSHAAYVVGTELVNAFDRATEAIADFAMSGFRDMNSFRQALADIFADIAKMILAMIIKILIMKAIEAGANALGFGASGSIAQGATQALDVGAGFAAGGRALGGPVTGGVPYVVGERGPELFVPPSSGNIVPNGQLAAAPEVNVNVVNVTNEDEIATALGSAKGEKTMLNVIQRNRTAIQRMLQG